MQTIDTAQLQLASLFEIDQPLEVEVGCGKAKFLVQRANDHPEINFIAVDRVWKFMKLGFNRANKRGLKNIRFIKTEAQYFIHHVLPLGSVSRFHIYFPDPWHKRRHRHRRLIQQDFLLLLWQKTQTSGWVQIATDYADYFDHIKSVARGLDGHWTITRESVNDRLFPAALKTNYELKYEDEGRTIHYLELKRLEAR